MLSGPIQHLTDLWINRYWTDVHWRISRYWTDVHHRSGMVITGQRGAIKPKLGYLPMSITPRSVTNNLRQRISLMHTFGFLLKPFVEGGLPGIFDETNYIEINQRIPTNVAGL